MEILAYCRAASIVTFCPMAMSSPCHLMQQKGNKINKQTNVMVCVGKNSALNLGPLEPTPQMTDTCGKLDRVFFKGLP